MLPLPAMATTPQSATVNGNGNIIVQAHGNNIRVKIGAPHLVLIPVAARIRKDLRRDIDILNPVYQAVLLAGRSLNDEVG